MGQGSHPKVRKEKRTRILMYFCGQNIFRANTRDKMGVSQVTLGGDPGKKKNS